MIKFGSAHFVVSRFGAAFFLTTESTESALECGHSCSPFYLVGTHGQPLFGENKIPKRRRRAIIIAKSKTSIQPGTGDRIKFRSANFGFHRLGGAFFSPQRPQRAQRLIRGERKKRSFLIPADVVKDDFFPFIAYNM